jgi:hypothetical protein
MHKNDMAQLRYGSVQSIAQLQVWLQWKLGQLEDSLIKVACSVILAMLLLLSSILSSSTSLYEFIRSVFKIHYSAKADDILGFIWRVVVKLPPDILLRPSKPQQSSELSRRLSIRQGNDVT